ncbi:uncharacterized protein J7T54_002235 [Emericellopsis cladophorae]|uniref:Cyclin-dependent protein kinase regulator pho80 n=1 Tax=Emericellopsis cladophorae TaxID=2686198 RepID=A0A9P9Y1B0_9HYPO|nr:uncharacterized protein J7T54_002235 [Emericellopsis cladophorae]KAI6781343.1 hypothetical protein J7T54_002235 [Emericellopsis cladophorae]
MRLSSLLPGLCAATLALAVPRTAQIYVQPILTSTASPVPLAEVAYDPFSPDVAQIVTYEHPELPAESSLVRVGLYDPKSDTWLAGTTVASTENFAKGYSPNILLTVDRIGGNVISAAVKGVAIDAGQTRDFGPKAVVVVESMGKQPELNKPIVLSPEGKKVEEVEKTFLQKYWYLLAIGAFLLISGGGGGS